MKEQITKYIKKFKEEPYRAPAVAFLGALFVAGLLVWIKPLLTLLAVLAGGVLTATGFAIFAMLDDEREYASMLEKLNSEKNQS